MPIWWRKRQEVAPLPGDDAEAMIQNFGVAAHEKARDRAREARRGDGMSYGHSAEHWYWVMRLIAMRQTGATGVDTLD